MANKKLITNASTKICPYCNGKKRFLIFLKCSNCNGAGVIDINDINKVKK